MPLTNAFGRRDTLKIERATMMTIQPPLTRMKLVTFLACKQALHQRNNERSYMRVAHESKVRGKKGRALFFHHPTRLRCSLTRSLATQKWRGCFQSITLFSQYSLFLLFPEPVCVRNSKEKFELFTYQEMPTTTPPLLFNPFQLTHF